MPNEPYATPSQTADRSQGALVTYTCDPGYFFNHNTQEDTEEITCQGTAEWSTLTNQCTSKIEIQ